MHWEKNNTHTRGNSIVNYFSDFKKKRHQNDYLSCGSIGEQRHHWWHRRSSLWQPTVSPVTTKLVLRQCQAIILVWGDMKVGIMTILGHYVGLRRPKNCYHYNSGWSSRSGESCLLRQRWWSRISIIFMMNILSPIMCMYSHLIYTHKMPARYISSSVWMRLSIFSQLSITQCMGLCVFSLPISLVMIERIHTLSYYHRQIGSMNYYPLLRVRSWNDGMRCMSLYVLIS